MHQKLGIKLLEKPQVHQEYISGMGIVELIWLDDYVWKVFWDHLENGAIIQGLNALHEDFIGVFPTYAPSPHRDDDRNKKRVYLIKEKIRWWIYCIINPLTLEKYCLGICGDSIDRDQIESRCILHGDTIISVRHAPGSGSFIEEIQKHRKPALSVKLDFRGYVDAMRAL
uniref:Uncharacterized protein n=1 Tax=Moniliophthora roreri TaxID=221103 RepID=A0A0W0G059_MONRR